MKTTDLFTTSSKKLNESLSKTFGKRINFENFNLDQLQDARNKLRTQISQVRGQSSFNENLDNDAYHQAQWMLDAINAEIAERDEHIIEAEVEEGKMKDLHQDVEEYLAYMSDVFNDREEYDLANELHNLSFELEKVGIGGVMKELKQLTYWGDPLAKGVYKEFSKKFGKFAEGFDGDLEEGEEEDVPPEVEAAIEKFLATNPKDGDDLSKFHDKAIMDKNKELDDYLTFLYDYVADQTGAGGTEEAGVYDEMLDMLHQMMADKGWSEGVGEGRMSDVDYDLRMIANDGDEDELISALQGEMGSGVADVLNDMMSELQDELAAKGMNDVMRDDDKMIEILWDKLVDEYGGGDFDSDEGGETDDDYALASAGFGSDEDYESIQYEDRMDEKAVSKAQQRAAGIALAAKRKGKTPPGKGAAAEMTKMTTKELEKYAGTKHKNLPGKKDESTDEGIISTPAKLIGKTIGGVAKGVGAIAGVPGGIARAFGKGKRRSQDVISGDDEDRRRKESVERGDKMTRLREGEVQQASAIVTAKTMVDRVGRWIEELSGMENETLLQLGDSIRDEMGQEQAKAFIEAVAPAIQSALETLKGTRDQLSTSVRSLASGEQPADMLGAEPAMGGNEMGMAEPDAMNMPAEEPAGDEFAAAEPAAGGMEAPGREQRESIERQNRLLKVLAG